MKEKLKNTMIKGFNIVFENCETLYIPSEYVIKFSFKERPVEYHFIKPFIGLRRKQKMSNKNDLRYNPHFYIHQSCDDVFLLIDNHAFTTSEVIEKSFTFDFEEKRSDKTDNLNTNCFLERLLKYNDIAFIEPIFNDECEEKLSIEEKEKRRIHPFWDSAYSCDNINQFSLRLKTKNQDFMQKENLVEKTNQMALSDGNKENEDLTLILVSSKYKKEEYDASKIEKDFEDTSGLLYALNNIFGNNGYLKTK